MKDAVRALSKKKIHGGEGDAEAIEHFVYRFPTLSSRLCYLLVDPHGTLSAISDAVLSSFSAGQLVILDLAGGTGAGTIGMLTTLAELRRERVVPTLPIQVRIYAADYSRKALSIYVQMIDNISADLRMAKIQVSITPCLWNAADARETSRLLDVSMRAAYGNELFVLVSNISGVGNNSFAHLERSFYHVAERVSSSNSTFLWVENAGNQGRNFLARFFPRVFPWMSNDNSEAASGEFRFFHVLQPKNQIINSGVSVRKFREYGAE